MVVKFEATNNYEEITSSATVVLVDFFAVWCGPCRMVAPMLDTMDEENQAEGRPVKMYKVDVDENMDLAQKLDISAMPTFLIYKDGKLEEKVIGADVPRIKNKISFLLEKAGEEPKEEEAVIVETDDVKVEEEA